MSIAYFNQKDRNSVTMIDYKDDEEAHNQLRHPEMYYDFNTNHSNYKYSRMLRYY